MTDFVGLFQAIDIEFSKIEINIKQVYKAHILDVFPDQISLNLKTRNGSTWLSGKIISVFNPSTQETEAVAEETTHTQFKTML